MRMITQVALIAATFLLSLTGCGSDRMVSYTYVKHNMSQQLLLDDEHRLKNTAGVTQVIPKIDDKNTGRIEVTVEENNKNPGLRLLQDLGYQQVRN
jgi:uncharacterized lipoprotein YehR (DUF1307 family)